MKKTLVVMRHGKAMPPALNQHDEDRELSKAGVAALGTRLPYMLRLLETRGDAVQIWSSPATRARQTAELVEKALQEKDIALEGKIEPRYSLWAQDVDWFLEDLRASDADLVFAVGHVPFVEEIVEVLAGSTPPFSTGAIACMEVNLQEADPEDPFLTRESARLLWFVQGPVSARWGTLIQLQATITKTAELIEDRRDAFFSDPKDIETIHRFRTNIRTLRSFVAFIKPWQNAEQNAETQTILRDVVRHTSRLRELDVLEKQVRANPDYSPELVAFCEEEASAERAKVLRILASKEVARPLEKALSSAKNVQWKKRVTKQGLPTSVVCARFDALIDSVSADIADLDLSDAERTHDVRKRAKRARYVAEFNAGILGEDAVDIATGMTAHQDVLGDVCDARANIRLIDEFLQQDLPKPVVRDLTQMRAQNEAFLHEALRAGTEKE